jgi:hypothetical protein
MSDSTREGQQSPPHPGPERMHETSDVSVRGVLWFGGGLIVFAIVVHLVLAWFFVARRDVERSVKASDLPLAKKRREQGPILPEPPRLEQIERRRGAPPSAKSDVIDPDTYGWVDRDAGIARVPVSKGAERAWESGVLRSAKSSGPLPGFFPSDASSGRRTWRPK